MSDKTKASLSQRAANAMNKPGFPETILDNPTEQARFVSAVEKASAFSTLPAKYQTAIKKAETGPAPKTVKVAKRR